MNEKEFYRNYEGDNIMRELNYELVKSIIDVAETKFNFCEKYILEFGCGQGKNLAELKKLFPGYICTGIDISFDELIKAKQLNNIDQLIYGYENILQFFDSSAFHISFTCSVLCHLNPDDARLALNELKAISEVVLIAETQDILPGFHWNHDYEDYGFRKISEAFISPGNGGKYFIWKWDGD